MKVGEERDVGSGKGTKGREGGKGERGREVMEQKLDV